MVKEEEYSKAYASLAFCEERRGEKYKELAELHLRRAFDAENAVKEEKQGRVNAEMEADRLRLACQSWEEQYSLLIKQGEEKLAQKDRERLALKYELTKLLSDLKGESDELQEEKGSLAEVESAFFQMIARLARLRRALKLSKRTKIGKEYAGIEGAFDIWHKIAIQRLHSIDRINDALRAIMKRCGD